MSPTLAHALADLVLFVHAGVVAFNIFWMIAIPIGWWQGWRLVRLFWWRAAHVASLLVVAIQPLLGRYCFLTLWQEALDAQAGAGPAAEPSFLERVATAAVFWPLPPWVFLYLYIAAFVWTAVLWWLVPPVHRARAGNH